MSPAEVPAEPATSGAWERSAQASAHFLPSDPLTLGYEYMFPSRPLALIVGLWYLVLQRSKQPCTSQGGIRAVRNWHEKSTAPPALIVKPLSALFDGHLTTPISPVGRPATSVVPTVGSG